MRNTLALPVETETASIASDHPGRAAARPLRSLKASICIADHVLAESLAIVLRLEGMQAVIEESSDHQPPRRWYPDFVLVDVAAYDDVEMPHVARYLKRYPNSAVFGIAGPGDVAAAVKAMKIGVSDVFVQPIDAEALLSAMADEARKWGTHYERGPGKLTQREHDVLALLLLGATNKHAAKTLGISPRTVEVHRARIMEKFDAHTPIDLARKAGHLVRET